MKKLGKVLLAFVLIFGVGFAGFTIGKNTGSGMGAVSQADLQHISQLNEMKELIKQNYLFDYDEQQLDDGTIKGMFANLGDPYTQYYTKDEFDKLLESLNGKYAGIGVVVQASKEGYIKAINIFKGTPADKAGIKPGDYIVKVNDTSYTADQMEEAVSEIKGKAGTKVKLTILRTKPDEDTTEEIELEVKRANVTVETVASKAMTLSGNKIGYLQLQQFEDVSYDEFMTHLKDLEDKEVEGIVLDLRNNPGGALDVCLKIADEFLDKGTIVSTVDKNGEEIVEESDDKKDDIPLVVLINENSASASEILAGALKDRKRAKIVGVQSFGKGIVQKLFPLADGTGAKITISEYFTPNKTKIHKIGVEPDIEVESNKDTSLVDIDELGSDKQFLMGAKALLEEINK